MTKVMGPGRLVPVGDVDGLDVQVEWVLLPDLPQLPTESPGWTWFPTTSVAEPRRGPAGRV